MRRAFRSPRYNAADYHCKHCGRLRALSAPCLCDGKPVYRWGWICLRCDGKGTYWAPDEEVPSAEFYCDCLVGHAIMLVDKRAEAQPWYNHHKHPWVAYQCGHHTLAWRCRQGCFVADGFVVTR